MHPTRLIQLSHTRVDDGIAGLALLPGFQRVLSLVPFKRVELGLEVRFGQIREVIKQVVAELAPGDLAEIGVRAARSGMIGLLDRMPDLARADLAEMQMGR